MQTYFLKLLPEYIRDMCETWQYESLNQAEKLLSKEFCQVKKSTNYKLIKFCSQHSKGELLQILARVNSIYMRLKGLVCLAILRLWVKFEWNNTQGGPTNIESFNLIKGLSDLYKIWCFHGALLGMSLKFYTDWPKWVQFITRNRYIYSFQLSNE